MTGPTSAARQFVERLAFLGIQAAYDDELRVQKVTLTLAAIMVSVLAIVWVGTYLALGLPVSAAIPFVYRSCRSPAWPSSPGRRTTASFAPAS